MRGWSFFAFAPHTNAEGQDEVPERLVLKIDGMGHRGTDYDGGLLLTLKVCTAGLVASE